jgi:excisionase family DNA binding protein
MPTHPPTLPPPRRLASITEAAEYVGVSPKTLRRYIASGRITGYRTGPRLIRVDLTELDAVLLQRLPTAAGA